MENDSLKDRLARLTFLCSELHKTSGTQLMSVERLEEILAEAEQLCQTLRREIRRRERR